MHRHSLIDLYVPGTGVALEEAAEAAGRARIDALVYVVDSSEEMPTPEELAALRAREELPALHPALLTLGNGYRYAVLLPNGASEAIHGALEVLDDAVAIQNTVSESGGCAIPVCPRQAPDGEVMRRTPRLAPTPPVGVLAVVRGGSTLGRDLDIEDAASGGRRVLGGTGPFGTIGEVGRYATVLPADPTDVESIIGALSKGLGAAVELLDSRNGGGGKRKRNRNRNRKRKRGGGGPEGGAPAQG